MQSIIINKKTINYIVDGEKNVLELLSTINKLGKNMFWKIYTIEGRVIRESWHLDGKVRVFPEIICEGKNIGRSNETSPSQQALLEALSKWNKQQDKGYSLVNNKINDEIDNKIIKPKCEKILPMLAQKFDERAKYINYPAAVSRKLDGIRMIAQKDDDTVNLTSRMGKSFSWMNKIREHIKNMTGESNIIFDGELYSHSIPFNAISGASRSTKKPSVYDDKMEYWVFDLVDCDMEYKDRVATMQLLRSMYHIQVPENERVIKFEFYETVETVEEIKNFHDKYVSEGYEGVMVRNFTGVYKLKHRSNNLQKFKEFEDSEFEIVGFKTGTVTEDGAIVFMVKDSVSEQTFDVRPRGTIDERIEKAKIGDSFIGKMLTVRYQKTGLDDGSLPRFPVGISIRDYE